MKQTVFIIAGLSVFLAGCGTKTSTVASTGGQQQVQAPVAPPSAAKGAAAAKGGAQTAANNNGAGTTAQPAAASKKLTPQQRADLQALLDRLSDAFFDYNESSIRPDATASLTSNVQVIRGILADYPAEKLLIEGHADERGSSEYNLALADRRSRAAQEFLSSRGIPQNQLSVLSLGEERPACTDQSEACYQQNRRVHITVAP